MKNLFKKVAVFSDLHLGEKADSQQHNQDCLDFVEWFCQQAKAQKVDRIIFIGDLFHNRSRLRLDTRHYGTTVIKMLLDVAPVELVVGNHDMFQRHDRNIHSLAEYAMWDGVTVHNDHNVVAGVGFCPYLIGPEYLEVMDMEAEYIFGHFELPLFLLNSTIEMKDGGGLNMDHFVNSRMVFSGHFHKRQMRYNASGIPVWYIGSPMGHNFNDVDDPDRGMMILEWGGTPEFINYTAGPLYQRMKVSELIEPMDNNTVGDFTRPTSILEIRDDIGLELEDITLIRETLLKSVREVRMVQGAMTPGLDIESEVEGIDDRPLQDIVVDHLKLIDPHGSDIDRDRLVRIFKGTN